MYEDTLDDSLLLGNLCHLDKSCIRVVVVCGKHSLHPAWGSFLNIVRYAVRKECLDVATADSDMNHSHLDVFRKRFNESSSEIVCRSQSCVRTAERWYRCVPLAFYSSHFRVVHNRHHLETVADILQILSFYPRIAFHVGLAETEVDVEIRILRECMRSTKNGA